jgi:predicted ATP-dependent protease
MEGAQVCQARAGTLVQAADIEQALQARRVRHDYPDQRLQESIADGDRLMTLTGAKTGQINGLTQIDLGDYRFGFPVRVTARTYAGDEGLLNIEREVEMSGPIHDKGVLILHSYLSALFAHMAPLALNASIVFEQEYHGVEGDSASCAELYVLLSSLSGLPLRQGIAVTGAVNLHGDVLPVGGINEKIEGYFRICEKAGLDGQQGVLIPSRNRRHLMLDRPVQDAVAQGLFHIYAAGHVCDGMALLTGFDSGMDVTRTARLDPGGYAPESVLGQAQKTLKAFRHACQLADAPKVSSKHRTK